MNLDELRAELDRLAGPEVLATDDVRGAVRRRADRARRRFGAMAATATVVVVVLVAVLVGGALRSGDGSNIKVASVPPTTTVADHSCDSHVAITPANDVPSDVAAWAQGAPVVGHGGLWTARSAIAVRALRQPDGTWLLKFPWFTRPFGVPQINGRRLDGAGSFHSDANAATDQRGTWVASSLAFSTSGCWEVTARFGGATITFRTLVGSPPLPLAIGTISGTLREVGGPAPGRDLTVAGTVRGEGTQGSWEARTTPGGDFSIDVPVGTYRVTGSSPVFLNDLRDACGGGTAVVTRGHTTSVQVICPVR
ncbi:MAG TPA: hypothetical protein VIK61_10565 [Acidimicrobiia bacterium]